MDSEPDGLDGIGAVPICQTCGSEQIVKQAWACWNRDSGGWELEHTEDATLCRACDQPAAIHWTRPVGLANHRIRDLNDAFRTRGEGHGSVFVTEGISAQGPAFVADVINAVRRFDRFTQDNDPWGEHDFGAVEIAGEKVFWKIDAYDLDLKAGSPNPANAAVTHRVLTVMLASEY